MSFYSLQGIQIIWFSQTCCELSGSESCVCVCVLSRVWLFATLWTTARQAPLSMGFFRQEYWSGFPFPLPGDLPKPGIKPAFPAPRALAGGFFTTEPPGKLSKSWPQFTDEEREVQKRVNYPSYSKSKRKLTFFGELTMSWGTILNTLSIYFLLLIGG